MNPNFLIIDFEYREDSPGRLHPVCIVALELETGRVYRQWLDEGQATAHSFPFSETTVLIAHSIASSHGRCWDSLGWPEPAGWIDTHIEEHVLARGDKVHKELDLLQCCRRRGIPVMNDEEHRAIRDLVRTEARYSDEAKQKILSYCERNVWATTQLIRAIQRNASFHFNQAMLRGSYAAECSRITNRGIPVDAERFEQLASLPISRVRKLIARLSGPHPVAPEGQWSWRAFRRLVSASGLDWPMTNGGNYKSDPRTISRMADRHGEPWATIARLRADLSEALISGLILRDDGRLVADMRPFGAITGRCAPRASEFILVKPKWLRLLVQSPLGRSLIIADWSGQEFAVAAALSGDTAMIKSYQSGDPYLELGRRYGRIPRAGTKASHPYERSIFKEVSLAVLMGMGPEAIGRKTGLGLPGGAELLRLHKRAFPTFWRWANQCLINAAAGANLETYFGLVYNPSSQHYSPGTARNFPIQAIGSDMLRIAVLLLAQEGVSIVATVHDSIVVECDEADADRVTPLVVAKMEEASRLCLHDKITVRVDAKRIDHPYHYPDDDGLPFFARIAIELGIPLDDREQAALIA